MITGHLATTLVAKREAPTMPWWLLAVAAMLIDIAMFTLVALGVEQMVPNPVASGPRLATTIVEMTYSHDLIPQAFWIGASGALAYLVTRNRQFTLIAMILTGAHWLGDLVAGYGHFVFGPESHARKRKPAGRSTAQSAAKPARSAWCGGRITGGGGRVV